MEPRLHKGQLRNWNDERGFGFIRPEDGSQDVFLHISALQRSGRRPQTGDTIYYGRVSANGKVRANRASIQGVSARTGRASVQGSSARTSRASTPARTSPRASTPQSRPPRTKRPKAGLLKSLVELLVLGLFLLIATDNLPFGSKTTPPPAASVPKQNCLIKGNISQNSGKRFYHLPGMEDYENTVVDSMAGERWFCTEAEAQASGWRKAPK